MRSFDYGKLRMEKRSWGWCLVHKETGLIALPDYSHHLAGVRSTYRALQRIGKQLGKSECWDLWREGHSPTLSEAEHVLALLERTCEEVRQSDPAPNFRRVS